MRRPLLLPFLILLSLLLPAAARAQGTPPTASTHTASPIGSVTATVRGAVDPNGQPVSYRFEYGTTSTYGLTTADQSAGSGTSAMSVAAALSGLTPDTLYHYRVIAWPDADPSATVSGGDRTFRTSGPPSAFSNAAQVVGATDVTLTGRVDPNRLPTTVYFEWGPTTAYGNQTPPMDAGKGSTTIEMHYALGGLTPNTAYHFRLVATNAAGTARGANSRFRTQRAPTGITINPLRPTVGFGGVTVVTGQVQGAGVAGIHVALESTPFPFTAPFTTLGGTATAASDGTFRLLTPPLQIARRIHVVTRSTPAVVSPDFTLFPSLLVGAYAAPRDARHYRITGRVRPDVTGAKVSVQRKVGSRWVFAKRTRTKPLGRGRVGYAVVVKRASKLRRYRVVVLPRTPSYAKTISRGVKVPALPRRHRH